MSYTSTCHPTEEALCECALHECNDELVKHLGECTQCNEFVEDVRTISHDIAALKDEPVPERLDAAILAITRCKEKNRIVTALQTWYKHPFWIGIVTIGFILLLYAVFSLIM